MGIGTTSPATRLDLQGTTFDQVRLWNTNGAQQFWQGSVADTVGSYIGNNAYYSSSYQFMPNYNAASGINFRQDGSTEFWNDTGLTSGTIYVPTKRMTILNNGNVGIGTSSPSYKLELAGTSGSVTQRISGGGLSVADANGFVGFHPTHQIPGNQYFTGLSYSNGGGSLTVGGDAGRVNLNFSNNSSYPLAFNSSSWGGSSYTLTERMRIDGSSGNVGIGTTAPSEKLEVNGNVKATAFLYTSDINLKKDILPVQNSLSKIVNMDAITFRYKTDASNSTSSSASSSSRHMGLIAQQVQKAFPETVVKNKDGFLSVDYPALIAPLVSAIKELYLNWFDDHKLIQSQFSEIEKLKMENEELKKRMNRIEQQLNQRSPAQAQ